MPAGATATLGVAVGNHVVLWLAIAGLAALLAPCSSEFKLVQYAGAAYLSWIGLTLIFAKPDSAPPLRMERHYCARNALYPTPMPSSCPWPLSRYSSTPFNTAACSALRTWP